MATGSDRFVLAQLDRHPGAQLNLPKATVTAITAGGSTDGLALVTVSYLGASIKLPYYAHYTPVVGHVVSLVRDGGVWTIYGRAVGFPPS